LDFGNAASLILVIDVVLSSKGQPLSSIWFGLRFSVWSVCANGKNAKLINGLNKSYASHWIDHIISNTGQISVTLRRRRRSALSRNLSTASQNNCICVVFSKPESETIGKWKCSVWFTLRTSSPKIFTERIKENFKNCYPSWIARLGW